MNRDVQNIQDDVIRMKRTIKQVLISDADIIEALNDPTLSKDVPDEFLDTHIFSYIRIPQTQDVVKNYICFTVIDKAESNTNEAMKIQYVQFYCISHLDDIKTPYAVERHDLLGYLVRDIFNWSNVLGLQLQLIHNQERSMDNDFYCRVLDFRCVALNSLNKACMFKQ